VCTVYIDSPLVKHMCCNNNNNYFWIFVYFIGLFLCCQLLPLTLLLKLYGYISVIFVLLLSYSVVTLSNMLFCLSVLQLIIRA
jgi:hypothetical protein